MKKILVVLLLGILLCGCSRMSKIDNNGNNSNDKNEYEVNYVDGEFLYAKLKINMPLNIEDLETLFEFPMADFMDENKIGEISGDGSPIDEYGPYATDIEFDIKRDKISEFKTMLKDYEFPKGSYLEIEYEKDSEFGSLVGIRIILNNFDKQEIEDIHADIDDALMNKYTYCSWYKNVGNATAYYYGKDRTIIKNVVNQYIKNKGYIDKIEIMDMSETIKEVDNE